MARAAADPSTGSRPIASRPSPTRSSTRRQPGARRNGPAAGASHAGPPNVPGSPSATVPAPRAACPCGSGRRYKACHGASALAAPLVARPFAGLPGEADWVALRELVPSATAPLTLSAAALAALPVPAAAAGPDGDDADAQAGSPDGEDAHAGVRAGEDADADGPATAPAERSVTLVTVLPLAWPALARADGEVLLAAQAPARSGDLSADLGQALLAALAAPLGTGITSADLAAAPPATPTRLQDLLGPEAPVVTVHPGFAWWLGDQEATGEAAQSLEEANASVVPTERLRGVEAAYWCRIGERVHLRWALPYEEESLLDGLARLSAAGGLGLGEGTRFLGCFRSTGILVPVWDLPPGTVADEVEAPAAALGGRLAEAVADRGPLDPAQRRARAGVVSRQLTLR